MGNCKFKIKQNIFVLPVKMPGVIKNIIHSSNNEKKYEVEVEYKNRAWRATFYEYELSDIE
ncbi:MAG: hypothetical protein CMH70_01495 [Nitrosomonadaceae bacterium]|nr:hypothetical protein [Nitrosomonadaceae bacterium]|tara:strand:- start:957 stop:1139 length:183 start_codon:yes stop_codon:yes gene_type:complete